MWFIYALLSSCLFGCGGFMMKVCSSRQGSTPHLLWGLYLSGTCGFLWWMDYTDQAHFTISILVAGLIIGFGSATGNILFMKALDLGPASLTAPIMNSNIILTIGLSVFLYGEHLTLLEGCGVFLLVVAILLLPIDPNENLRIRNIHWYIFVLTAMFLFFLRNGGLKITEEMHLLNAPVLFISYVFGLIWFSIHIASVQGGKKKKTGLLWGLGTGIFSFAGLQMYAIALKEGPGSIVAPIFATNSLIIAILSILIYKERLSRVQTLCLLLLFSGLILIRL